MAIMPVERVDMSVPHGEAHRHVMFGLTICANNSPFCGRAARKHRAINRYAKEYVNGMAYTNGIKSVRAILKRGYKWVYHNWSEEHCCRHVNEFAFRFNEGSCKRDTQGRLDGLFRLMACSV